MTDKLNDNDKERIYKEVNRIFNESESVDLVHELMFKVGEYEHNYQREQQSSAIKELSEFKEAARRQSLELYKLEAERSELRNEVIEECIEVINNSTLNIDWKQQLAVKLNSLKK